MEPLRPQVSFPYVTTVLRDGDAPGPWRPVDIAFAPDGAIYVLSCYGQTKRADMLYRLREDGSPEVVAYLHRSVQDGGELRQNAELRALACSPDGSSLYVADAGTPAILRIDAGSWQVSELCGGSEGFRDGLRSEAQFREPTDVICEPDGSLLVVDHGNCAIRRVTPEGEVSTFTGALWDEGTHTWQPVAPKEEYTEVEEGPRGKVSLPGPWNAVRGPDGLLYVSCTGVIYAVDQDGGMAVVAGASTGPDVLRVIHGQVDGPRGTGCLWRRPCPLACAADGSIYLGGVEVRRLSSDGVLTTVVGDRWDPLTARFFCRRLNIAGFRHNSGLARSLRSIPDGPRGEAQFYGAPPIQWPTGGWGPRMRVAGGSPMTGMAFAPDGSLYVVDRGLRAVRRIVFSPEQLH